MELEALHALFLQSSGVTTDTRSIRENQLFFALKGERFDGNQFAKNALAAGCLAVVADDPALLGSDNRIHVVDNALTALQDLARYHRELLDITVIGLTGSNGKTTSKELIRDVLATTYPTYATRGNLNNHIGVPLSLLELKDSHRFAVIEMGANAQKEIAFLSRICLPDYGYITNIGKAHLEGFGGEEGVKKGKKELFDYLEETGGTAFVNTTDPVLMDISSPLKRILFGSTEFMPKVEMRASEPFLTYAWTAANYASGDQTTHLKGAYNLSNIAAAIAIGSYFGVSATNINKALTGYTPENNRSQFKQTAHNALILDAYNANPSSMEHALRSFAVDGNENKLCILGDMFELGEASPREHRAIAQLAKDLGLKALYVGKHFQQVLGDSVAFATTNDLKEQLLVEPVRNKTILIKGSRGMQLEQIVELL